MSICERPDIETSSEGYAGRFAGKTGRYLLRVQENGIRQMLKGFGPGSTVLEVAGGHGQITQMLVESGYRVDLFVSPGACNRRLESFIRNSRVRLIEGELNRIPYSSQSIDVVIALRLICHLAGWRAQIAELCRVARRAVIIDYPCARSINILAPRLFPVKKAYEGNAREYALFSDKRLDSEFSLHGFVPAARYRQFFFPMVLHRMLNRPAFSKMIEGLARVVFLPQYFGSPVILRMDRD
ncbi:MAG: class I SAM-dependent methyltransferase [Candidatus Omnitrophica bacterium]|nr:class I SAM-dependent methyltransferase [Candidatus Omnitrophota bacterium]